MTFLSTSCQDPILSGSSVVPTSKVRVSMQEMKKYEVGVVSNSIISLPNLIKICPAFLELKNTNGQTDRTSNSLSFYSSFTQSLLYQVAEQNQHILKLSAIHSNAYMNSVVRMLRRTRHVFRYLRKSKENVPIFNHLAIQTYREIEAKFKYF